MLTLIINANFDFCALTVFQIKGIVFMRPVSKSGTFCVCIKMLPITFVLLDLELCYFTQIWCLRCVFPLLPLLDFQVKIGVGQTGMVENIACGKSFSNMPKYMTLNFDLDLL